MDKIAWTQWRFNCHLYSYNQCKHPARSKDHENRCYCASHKEAYGFDGDSQSVKSYNIQSDIINEYAWKQCPLKTLTIENAYKEAMKQSIQLQITYAVLCAEKEINARMKLKAMKELFEEKYHEKL